MAATFDFLPSGALVAEAEAEGVTTTVVFWGAALADVAGAAVDVDVEGSVELDTTSGSSASGRALAIPVS
jgi:hypothetical protein